MKNGMSRYLLIFFGIVLMNSAHLARGDESRGLLVGKTVAIPTQDGGQIELYDGSYALVIGNNAYQSEGWGKLDNAVKDAQDVAQALKTQGFEVTLETDITAEQFKEASVRFFNKYGQREKNRLLFYYAGHGYSKPDPYTPDKRIGYIVMVDTPSPDEDQDGFDLKSIELEFIEKKANQSLAHHILFMFDSCFSGAIFDTMRGSQYVPQYITESVSRPVRQFITAGESGEAVPDESAFKKVFLGLLRGDYPEATKDGYLTGSELGQYLYQEVVNATDNQQHPQYGKSRNIALNKGDFVFVAQPPAAKTRTIEPTASQSAAKCVTATTAFPPVFPYALSNSMESGDFPYWFHVTMQNDCEQDVLFDMSFNLLSGPAVLNAEKKVVYKIPRGTTFAQSVPFPVDFSTPDVDGALVATWTIHRNDDLTILDQGTAKIVVLPKSRYCWNLANFDGSPVSQEFLFAALTAWAQAADANLKQAAQVLAQGVTEKRDRAVRARQWFEQCYAKFQGDAPLEVTPFQKAFPPETCWDAQPPVAMLQEGWGDPLEAALLVGAFTKKAAVQERFGMNVALYILPAAPDAPEQPTFLLGWSLDGKAWQAINMAQANLLPFAENVEQASAALMNALMARPKVREKLAQTGVVIDPEHALYAVEFGIASKRFHIRALP